MLISQEGGSIGDFLVSSIGGGGGFEQFANYAASIPVTMRSAKEQIELDAINEFSHTTNKVSLSQNLGVIFGNMPSLTDREAEILMDAMGPRLRQYESEVKRSSRHRFGSSLITGAPNRVDHMARLEDYMGWFEERLSTPQEDPVIEEARKKALRDWTQNRETFQRVFRLNNREGR